MYARSYLDTFKYQRRQGKIFAISSCNLRGHFGDSALRYRTRPHLHRLGVFRLCFLRLASSRYGDAFKEICKQRVWANYENAGMYSQWRMWNESETTKVEYFRAGRSGDPLVRMIMKRSDTGVNVGEV